MAKAQVPNSGTPLILFIVLIIVLIWMFISFASFGGFCAASVCGFFFLPPILGLIACICGIIGILLAMSLLMFITTVAAIIIAVLDIIAVIIVFAEFSSSGLGAFAFTIVVFIISAICWASIAHASWQCKKLYGA